MEVSLSARATYATHVASIPERPKGMCMTHMPWGRELPSWKYLRTRSGRRAFPGPSHDATPFGLARLATDCDFGPHLGGPNAQVSRDVHRYRGSLARR